MGELILRQIKPLIRNGDPTSPFVNLDGFNDQWWKPGAFMMPFERSKDYFNVLLDGVEVARIKVDSRRTWPFNEFDVPESRSRFVEIVRIEVLPDYRCNGIGREIIGMLMAEFPGENFVADSTADGFWERLRWDSYTSQGNPRLSRKLFIYWA